MHKYWARKPHNVVAEYIKNYSQEGDIILDPFVGSGVTATEGLKLKRKVIAVDLDPIAAFITHCTAISLDLIKFREAFEKIKEKLAEKIHSLYETHCPKCKLKTVGEAVIWNNGKPIDIRYSCSCTSKVLWKTPTAEDNKLIKDINKKPIRYWYPRNELIHNTRINVHPGTRICDLLTRRNLIALSAILHEIGKIKDKTIRDLLLFTFSSALPQASKLVFVYRIKGREKQVGGWATRGYWVPDEFFEINAWNCFEERFKKVLRGKGETNNLIPNCIEGHTLDDLRNNANLLILNQSSLDLKNLPSESVDYVFTDPPYGDSVPYLELDYMWNSWLKFNVNWENEIIISNSPLRKKDFDLYEKMLRAAFAEVFRVLKSGKYLTVTFHNTDIKIWNSILSAVTLNGFDLEKIIFQPPARPSAKGLLAPYGSAIGDYYIRFKSPLILQ